MRQVCILKEYERRKGAIVEKKIVNIKRLMSKNKRS